MSLLERGGEIGARLEARLILIPDHDIATTVVSYEEQCQGWLAEINRAKTPAVAIEAYHLLSANLVGYCAANLLPFDSNAAQIYERLLSQRLRVGTHDLRIAAITLANDAVLLTRNFSDFSKVPHLRIEDWTV